MAEQDPAIGHHADQIAIGQFELQVPADAKKDGLVLKLTTQEYRITSGARVDPAEIDIVAADGREE